MGNCEVCDGVFSRFARVRVEIWEQWMHGSVSGIRNIFGAEF